MLSARLQECDGTTALLGRITKIELQSQPQTERVRRTNSLPKPTIDLMISKPPPSGGRDLP